MKHIVSFSTGLSSALTVERVLERYGTDNVDIVFMDTLAEDEDNYRFFGDCQARWNKEIIVLTDGRTPRQVAEDKQIIPNQKIAPCTFELKIKMFREWLKKQNYEGYYLPPVPASFDLYDDGGPVRTRENYISTERMQHDAITIHIGYDIFEAHRCEATRKNYETEGWLVDFPLMWKPLEHRPYSQVVRDDWGIEPPRTYAMGFNHANCLGDTFCFKVGVGDAIRVLINFPDQYKRAEDWEEMMRDHPVRKDYSILRDQTGGTVKPLPLKKLRERWEAKKDTQPTLFDLDQRSPACVSCGIGDMLPVDKEAIR